MSKLQSFATRSIGSGLSTAMAVALMGILSLPPGIAEAAVATPLPISQVPLTVSQPTHPQVLFAIGNSQSMDGDLSGAILTGSGALSSGLSSLSNSTSPTNYTVPSGFTPPLNAGTGGVAPYTTNATGGSPTTGTQYDNSASRLNVAKQGIAAILNQYMPSTDFALMDYNASVSSVYTTWVYLMSPNGGFSFSNSNTSAPTGTRYISNPCASYNSASSTVKSNCSSIVSANLYSSSTLSQAYMLISASSDDPSINDVLYAGGQSSIFDTYNGPNPASPYPPNFSLTNYENGSIFVSYNSSAPNNGSFGTSPTNAGYVPFSTQVIYSQRGFGYDSTASATTGNTLVTNKTAGTSPTAATAAAAIAYFTPFLAPETNSSGTTEIKALSVQSPLAGLMAGALTTLNASKPTTVTGCTPTSQYVVLITDGLPTQDLNNKSWPPLGSASATGYGVTATFNSDGSLNTTNDQALTDTINNIAALKSAGIQTYVVGLGAGVDPTVNPQAAAALAAMAVAGGTASASPQKYFPAVSAAALVTDLQSILTNVSSQNASTSAAAINTATLSANSQLYQAIFNPGSSINNAWIGDLDEYSISTSGVISNTATWSAQTQLDASTSRNIATWDPNHVSGTGTSATVVPSAVGFSWANLSSTLQAQLQPSDTNGSLRVDYLRGSHAQEQSNGSSTGAGNGIFRNRLHLLGDIVDSAPAYVGPPSGPYSDASYSSFVIAQANRTAMLYFGANDGLLHGVNATTGNEVMGFIPNGVFSNLYKLTDPLYFYHHQFFVDGSPSVTDALLSDGNWHSLLVGGENAGGNSIYAVDVTNPGNFTSDTSVASAVKWEFTDADMGLSFSAPTIVRSNAVSVTDQSSSKIVNGFAVLFGNGYNSASEQPIFYAVDASTGVTIAKINLCTATGVPVTACNLLTANGLSSIAAANSSGVLGVPQDIAYAGDLQGNVWGINMSNSDPTKWTVELLFQARDGSGNAQPITTTPTLTPNPNFPNELGLMVYIGTGRFIATGDLTNTNIQSFYGIFDNSSDLASYASPIPTLPYTRSNLQSQTLSLSTYTVPSGFALAGTTENVVLGTNNPVNLTYASETVTNPSPPPATVTVKPQEGWYFDVSPVGSGARIFTNSLIYNGGVQFVINVPPTTTSTSCGTPSSYLMNVNYATGGPFSQASLGLNGGINVGGSVNGQNPTGVSTGNAYGSAPTSIPTGNGTNLTIISTSNGLQAVATQGVQSGHVGWWQVQ